MASALNPATARPAGSTGMTLVATALVLLLASGAAFPQAQKQTHGPGDKTPTMYKWIDADGVTHYGDSVPSQYSDQEKQLLNSQGVQVGTIAGRPSAEQLAREKMRLAEEDRAKQAHERDQHLLATYLTVEEIENLRDRRFEILEGQARVTQQYLENVRGREHSLLLQAARFQPYSRSATGGPIPDRLAEELVRTESDIHNQERNLDGKRQEVAAMKAQFDSDIARFRELKKAEAEQNRGVVPRG